MTDDEHTQIRAPDELADIFKKRRAELRLRQEDVGRLSGTGRFTVAAIEKGRPGKSLVNMIAIADALQLDIVLKAREIVHVIVPEGED